MAFASTSLDKISAYLGYSSTNSDVATIQDAMDAVEDLSDATVSGHAVTRIESYLTTLDTITTAIATQRATEGSTLLGPLRAEARRYIAWVGRSLDLSIISDVIGTTPDAT